MGYQGVEFAGYYDHTASQLKKILQDNGLKCCGVHIGLDKVLGEMLTQTVDFHLELGAPYLIVPWIPEERRNSRAAWLATAALFDEITDQLRPHGLRTGYHNHSVEFQRFDGEAGLDTFFSYTQNQVILQLDIGNAIHGGADALAFLHRYPGRSTTIHLKEYSAANPEALLGEGDVLWQKVFEFCEQSGGTEWYIVEQESYPVPPLQTVRRCRENLRKLGR
jgi:sugar phosphate isomerase/epimerase